jgi:hypothetical protein
MAIEPEESELRKIHRYLGLDKPKDGRLAIKANIMMEVLHYCSEWKEGHTNQWIDRLATRTCVSTRKIREDYVTPLISEGILERSSEGFHIKFIGLPVDAEMPVELTLEELREELDEENENRSKLGKPRVSLEEWKRMRSKRKRPLES